MNMCFNFNFSPWPGGTKRADIYATVSGTGFGGFGVSIMK